MKRTVTNLVYFLLGAILGSGLCSMLHSKRIFQHRESSLRLIQQKGIEGGSLLLEGENILYISPDPKLISFHLEHEGHKIAMISVDRTGDAGLISSTFLMKTKKSGRSWYQVINPDFSDDVESVRMFKCGEMDPDYIGNE